MKIFDMIIMACNKDAVALENVRTLELLQHEICRYMTTERKIDGTTVAKPAKGICNSITLLFLEGKITHLMAVYCKIYIQSNRPRNKLAGAYYWPEGEIEPRLKFIKTHIKKLKRKVFIYKVLKTILP